MHSHSKLNRQHRRVKETRKHMKSNRKVAIGVFIISLGLFQIQTTAHAGNESSGGGDEACIEYYDKVNNVAKAFIRLGDDVLQKAHPRLIKDELLEAARSLKCEPVMELDRTARTFLSQRKTQLLKPAWVKLTYLERYRLSAHELMVVLGIEDDGEYSVSTRLFSRVLDAGYIGEDRAEKIIPLPNGLVKIIRPFMQIGNERFLYHAPYKISLLWGACRSLGFEYDVNYTSYRSAWLVKTGGLNTSEMSVLPVVGNYSKTHFVSFDFNGKFDRLLQWQYIMSLVCTEKR